MPDPTDAKVWFITGCSTGFGRELARQLLDRGDRVVVTARDPLKVENLVEGSRNGLAVKLDVTDRAQIEAAVRTAEARFGRIDVLVNNAGYGYLAAIEEGDEDDVRALFDTNVFGLATTIRAVLPGMRTRGSGTIVNISSMGGFVGFPGVGYYNASKFAVEGLSEALAKEIEPLGLRVLLVEPGPFRTDWAGRSLKVPKIAIDAYRDTAIARRETTAANSGSQAGDPVRGAAVIVDAVDAKNSPFRLALGKLAVEVSRAKLAAVKADLDAWEARSLAADSPPGKNPAEAEPAASPHSR